MIAIRIILQRGKVDRSNDSRWTFMFFSNLLIPVDLLIYWFIEPWPSSQLSQDDGRVAPATCLGCTCLTNPSLPSCITNCLRVSCPWKPLPWTYFSSFVLISRATWCRHPVLEQQEHWKREVPNVSYPSPIIREGLMLAQVLMLILSLICDAGVPPFLYPGRQRAVDRTLPLDLTIGLQDCL